MSQAVTFDDVWKMFQEVSAQMRETDHKFQEMVREDRERRAELDRRFQDTDRKIKEVSSQMLDTDRKVKEVSQQVGNLGSRWGEFVEGIVAPACETLFAERGIPVHRVSLRVKARSLDGSRRMEIDLLVDNTDSVVLVEVKSRLTAEDVRDHLKRVHEFKEFYEGEGGARVMGAVAGILIDNGVDKFAMNEGLFVIVQSGDSVKLANNGKFVPRTW
ncbi:MAG TPA: DUF3782 domain-containing protein [Magnetococcales bacterium]|nr:DUF3782 domain-containing protein [Magnetococcales bacterium]